MKIVAILQARMGSERLPGKVLAPLAGKPMLAWCVGRLRGAKNLSSICVATTSLTEDDPIADYCRYHLDCDCYRGNSKDVLMRYRECARFSGADVVVRVTGDNPVVDPSIVDEAITWFSSHSGLDYVKYRQGLPLGLSVEVFTRDALECAYYEAPPGDCREHVTPYFYRNPKKFAIAEAPCFGDDLSWIRLTVDTAEDLATIRSVFSIVDDRGMLTWVDAALYLTEHPEAAMNNRIEQRGISYKGGCFE